MEKSFKLLFLHQKDANGRCHPLTVLFWYLTLIVPENHNCCMYLVEDPGEISGLYSPRHLLYQFFCEICPSTDAGDEQGQEETGRNATCVPVVVKEQTVFTDILQERESLSSQIGKTSGYKNNLT